MLTVSRSRPALYWSGSLTPRQTAGVLRRCRRVLVAVRMHHAADHLATPLMGCARISRAAALELVRRQYGTGRRIPVAVDATGLAVIG